MVAAFLL